MAKAPAPKGVVPQHKAMAMNMPMPQDKVANTRKGMKAGRGKKS